MMIAAASQGTDPTAAARLSCDMQKMALAQQDYITEPVDADVRILNWESQNWRSDPSHSANSIVQVSRFDEYVSEAQVPCALPDPIRIRGVGATTLYVDLNYKQLLTVLFCHEVY